MRKLVSIVGVLCVVGFVSRAFSAPQSATTPVTIRVSDQSGASIAHAQIRIVPAPDPAPARLETDEHGQLLVNLKAGGYALSASAQGFTRYIGHVDISIPEGKASAGQLIVAVLEVGHGGGPTVVLPASAEGSLVLTADPYHAPVVLSPADFRTLPHVTITVHNSHSDATETYSGVPLAALLAKVNSPLGKELRGEAMTSYVLATGTDGYSVVLSLAEVDPSFHEGQVIVADTRDGQPLGKSGPFQLIMPGDKRPARWVHNLNSISLQHGR